MSKQAPDWFKWKYDLCENEIQCDGNTIAYAENSIFGIKDKEEFGKKLRELGLRLGWLIERANLATEMYEELVSLHSEFCESNAFPGRACGLCHLLDKAWNRQATATDVTVKEE